VLRIVTRKIQSVVASSLELEEMVWLWEQRIPISMFSLIYGTESRGKGLLWVWMTARLTRGELPGAFFGTPVPVLVAASEDAIKSVILPRLIVAGADLDLVHFLSVQITDGEDVTEGSIELPADVMGLGEEAKGKGAKWIVADPLISKMEDWVDTWKASEVRRALEPYGRMIEEYEIASTGVMHLNRVQSKNPMRRVAESKAFHEFARSACILGLDPDDPDERGDRRVLAFEKSNLTTGHRPTHRLRIEGKTIEYKGKIANPGLMHVDDGGECDFSPADVLAAEDIDARSSGPTKKALAVQILRKLAATNSGTVDPEIAKAAIEGAGISESTLRDARKELGVVVQPEHHNGVSGSSSRWKVPADPEDLAKRVREQMLGGK
jgi:AAA domain